MQLALHQDSIMFNILIKIMLLSREVRLSNLITRLKDFKKLFKNQSNELNTFMKRAVL
jgi:hypothetical protein